MFTISIGIGSSSSASARTNKGRSIIDFPDSFVVIDVETTGLDPAYDSLLEVSALKVENGQIIDRFVSLLQPPYFDHVSSFIEELTGITTEMVKTAPPEETVLKKFFDFIGNSILVGHNVNFDVNFLYDKGAAYDLILKNDFIDTMRISRKVFPEQHHHRLFEVASYLGISPETAHRAEADTETTLQCFLGLKSHVLSKMSLSDFQSGFKGYPGYKRANHLTRKNELDAITAETTEFDETHPLYGKVVVFTGTLSRMTRKEAFQIVANLGGIPSDSLSKKTNYLVVGNEEFASSVKNGQSSKMMKAESYRAKGVDILTISENTFFDLVESD
mgnify:CR=1 FL=1